MKHKRMNEMDNFTDAIVGLCIAGFIIFMVLMAVFA